MTLEETVIYNIRKYRRMKGLSQENLAEMCNTSTSYIGLMETGKNIPKLSTIERIANALEVEPHKLFLTENAQNNDRDKDKVDNIIKGIKSVLENNL